MRLIGHIPVIKQLEIINRLSFFRDFTLAERQIVLESFSHLYLISKGRFAFKEHEQDNQLYILLSGELSIFHQNNGKEIGRVSAGEFVGEGAFVSLRERSVNARALSDTIVLAITPDALTRLPANIREKIKDRIIEGMSNRIHALNQLLEKS